MTVRTPVPNPNLIRNFFHRCIPTHGVLPQVATMGLSLLLSGVAFALYPVQIDTGIDSFRILSGPIPVRPHARSPPDECVRERRAGGITRGGKALGLNHPRSNQVVLTTRIPDLDRVYCRRGVLTRPASELLPSPSELLEPPREISASPRELVASPRIALTRGPGVGTHRRRQTCEWGHPRV
jgi:hypothetical protein